MRVTAIGGIPASGKTYLMQEILARLDRDAIGFDFKEGLVQGRYYPTLDITVLGNYRDENDKFAGTDRLSMAAQPVVLDWIVNRFVGSPPRSHILFEGDRLFNTSFFMALKAAKIHVDVYILLIDDTVQAQRCMERGSDQNSRFLKGRWTKIKNICVAMKPVVALPNNTIEEQIQNIERILLNAKGEKATRQGKRNYPR
jgi:hypothetical protein